MRAEELEDRWRQLSEEVISGMKEWRLQHPRATFREIEGAVDERLGRLRARMLEDAALVSRAAEWEAGADNQPCCPRCGKPMQAKGQKTRELTTQYDQPIRLKRSYALCPHCQEGFFPPR